MEERLKMFAGKGELNWSVEEALDAGEYVIARLSGVGNVGGHASNMK